MYKKDHVVHLLQKIKQTLERIIAKSKEIDSYQYYYLTPAGMERLESTCMLLIAVGESIKGIDKLTNKELLTKFPEIDWKGASGKDKSTRYACNNQQHIRVCSKL